MRVAFLLLFATTLLGWLALALWLAFLTSFGALLALRGRSAFGLGARAGSEVQFLCQLLQHLKVEDDLLAVLGVAAPMEGLFSWSGLHLYFC